MKAALLGHSMLRDSRKEETKVMRKNNKTSLYLQWQKNETCMENRIKTIGKGWGPKGV